jgi:hypothetical protein
LKLQAKTAIFSCIKLPNQSHFRFVLRMGILSNILSQRPSASPDSVTFDASRYQFQGDRDGARVWFLPEGGGVGLYYFPRQPGLPQRAVSVGQLREFYAAQMGNQLKLVECRVLALDGIRSIWLIAKGQDQQTRGSVYLGSLTIPFRDFSFVIKIQCQEQGVTGAREALLTNEALRKGTGRIESGRFVPTGWSFDDEQFDDKLPQHPLSRVRRELRHIASSTRIEPSVRNAAKFELPENDA